MYTLSQDGKLVLQTNIAGIENDKTPPVIVQTADGSYFLVDADGNATSVKLDVGTPSDLTVSGTLNISDVDTDDSPYFENTSVESTYGTLTLTDGVWTYVLDETKSASLAEGEIAQDVITLTASDGTEQQITISVTGSDDKPVVTGDVSAQISEDSASQSVTGTLAITDPDAETPPAFNNVTLGGSYGTLVLVDGVWTYTLNANAQTLTDGEQQQEVFTLTATDGTVQEIVITVTGENDASVITGTFSGSVTEANAGAAVSTSGSLSVSDADGDVVSFEEGTQVGNYGTFALMNGEWTYTLDHNKADSLNEGQQVTDTFTVKATDGTTQDIVVNITGSDDAAVLSGTTTGTINNLTPSTQNVSISRDSDGTWDVSEGNNLYLNISNVGSDAAYNNSVGYYVLDANGNVLRAAILFDNAHNTSGTSVNINTSGGEKVGLFMIRTVIPKVSTPAVSA